MTADIIQAQQEQLANIAKQFQQRATTNEEQRARVTRQMEALADGGWEGRGATAFFDEMRQDVLPALERLTRALQEGHLVTIEISRLLRQAEEAAAEPFRKMDDFFTAEGGGQNMAVMLGGFGALPGLSPVANVIGGFFKGIAMDALLPQRFRLVPFTPNLARGKTTVAALMDMATNNGRGLPLIRFDGPHRGTAFPHINIHPQLTGRPDPHTPISPRLLNASSRTAHLLRGAQRIAVPVAIATDVFRLGSAFHADGNQVGEQTRRTVGSVAGGWGGALVGAKAGAAGGAMIGGALGTVFPGVGNVVGAGVGGFVGGIAGAIGGGIGGSWVGEKLGGWF